MRSADDICKLIKKLQVEPGADMDVKVHSRITKTLEEWKKTKPALVEPNIWRKIMKSRITKLAVAAVIMIGVIIGANYFGVRIDGNSVAWANIAERVQKSKAFIYHMYMTSITEGAMTVGDQTIDMPDMEMNWNCIFSQEYGMKMEMRTTVNEKTIVQLAYMILAENRMVVVMPDQKKYMRIEFGDDLVKNMQEQQEKNDPRNMFKQVMDCDHIELGRKVIDGIEVEGLETTDPKYGGGMFEEIVARIWVEVETGWPVLMEMDVVMESPVGEGFIEMHTVMDGFQWDVQVDPDEFVPEIPEDYTSLLSMKVPKMDAEAAIEGLKEFAELTGHYPEKLNLMSMIQEFQKVKSEKEKQLNEPSIKELTQKLVPLEVMPENISQKELGELMERNEKALEHNKKIMEEIKKQMDELNAEVELDIYSDMKEFMPIQSLGMFYMQLVQQNKDPHYYGDRVEPGDAEQILMIWKGDEGSYEVIYGDLSNAVLTPDQVPQLDDIIQEP